MGRGKTSESRGYEDTHVQTLLCTTHVPDSNTGSTKACDPCSSVGCQISMTPLSASNTLIQDQPGWKLPSSPRIASPGPMRSFTHNTHDVCSSGEPAHRGLSAPARWSWLIWRRERQGRNILG